MTVRTLAATAALMLLPAAASAHPGHGHIASGTWAHYLLEPVHAIPLAVVAWFAVLVVAFKRRRTA